MPPYASMNIEAILIYQRKDPVLRVVHVLITDSLRAGEKTLVINASPVLLEFYLFFSNLFIFENTKLNNKKTQFLQNKDELPQSTDVKLLSQTSRLCLPLKLIKSMNTL